MKLPEGIASKTVRELFEEKGINLYYPDETLVQFSTDETTTEERLNEILELFSVSVKKGIHFEESLSSTIAFAENFKRKSEILQQEAFNKYQSETEMMRYIRMLERKDISLTQSMISLGSCTMKLNAASQLLAVSWPEFASIHPFVPIDQTEGYHQLINELEFALKEITGFETISFQPNSS